jgi:hypothetical protein
MMCLMLRNYIVKQSMRPWWGHIQCLCRTRLHTSTKAKTAKLSQRERVLLSSHETTAVAHAPRPRGCGPILCGKRQMLLRRTASWRGPFCFLVDANGSEASLSSRIMLYWLWKIIFYYIIYKYIYVWYLFINKQHNGILEHIYVWSWLRTSIKELTDSQIDNSLYAPSIIEPSLCGVTSS